MVPDMPTLTRLLFLLAILLALPVPVSAGPPPAKGKATIRVGVKDDALVATIRLNRATRIFSFEKADALRVGALRPIPQAQVQLALSEEGISASAPAKRFELTLPEDTTPRDAKYPVAYRVGGGWLFYAPALYGDDQQWENSLEVGSLPTGWGAWRAAGTPGGYVYVGPRQAVSVVAGSSFVFDGNVPPAFRAEVRDAIVRSVAFFEKSFGLPPEPRPFAAVRFVAAERPQMIGDVTPGAMVALRYYGDEWKGMQGSQLAQLRSTILHEAFHFWNGGVANPAEGTPSWLHEGGAEYAALLASREIGWTSDADFRAAMASKYNQCRSAIEMRGNGSLAKFDFLPAGVRYSCGPLLQFLTELELVRARSGNNVLAVWAATVTKAKGGNYGLADFTAASGFPDLLQRPSLRALIEQSGPERWNIVEQAMRDAGVVMTRSSSGQLRARGILMHLLKQNCTFAENESYGFSYGAGSYVLEAPEGCGELAGAPKIVAIAGNGLPEISAETYAKIQADCLAGRAILLKIDGGRTVAAKCSAPLADAETELSITSLPQRSGLR